MFVIGKNKINSNEIFSLKFFIISKLDKNTAKLCIKISNEPKSINPLEILYIGYKNRR